MDLTDLIGIPSGLVGRHRIRLVRIELNLLRVGEAETRVLFFLL